MPDVRRRVPSVDALLRSAPGRRAAGRFGGDVVKGAIRSVVDEVRGAAARGREPPEEEIIMARAVNLAARMALGLSAVINATGVVLHTNLGRAPLPDDAARAAARTARHYSDLEVERETGKRGRRTARAEFLLTALTGAEDALVVNNNAAALLLTLAALARRKDVLVSRGELIEIGGEFPLPPIIGASGARLVPGGAPGGAGGLGLAGRRGRPGVLLGRQAPGGTAGGDRGRDRRAGDATASPPDRPGRASRRDDGGGPGDRPGHVRAGPPRGAAHLAVHRRRSHRAPGPGPASGRGPAGR